MKKIAVVTGASSGIGKEFVRLLAQRTEIDEIWAVARDREKLSALVLEFGEKVKPYSLDVANTEAVREFGESLKTADLEITFLINSAGYGKIVSYDEMNISESLNMINVNACGVVSMTLACLPFMPAGSRIINLASQASFQPMPYFNIYAATKAFVRYYSRGLNFELKSRKITVTAVCPGWVKTPFIEKSVVSRKKTLKKAYGAVSPEVVARKALRDAEKGKDMSVPSLFVKFSHLGTKILPQKFAMKMWLKQIK